MFRPKNDTTPTTEAVLLKNGSTEAKVVVVTTMISLRSLMQKNPIAFYELVQKCKDPMHQMFGNTEEIVEKLSFFSGDRIHDTIRNVVLSAVTGEGFDISLTSPVQDPHTNTMKP